jgi:hypothetical protein
MSGNTPMRDRTVRVKVTNTDSQVSVSVEPWAAHVKEGQQIKWVGSAKVTDIRIRKHGGRRWILKAPLKALKATKRRRASVRSGERKEFRESAVGIRVPYTIDLHFKDNKGKRRAASIDPDMVID